MEFHGKQSGVSTAWIAAAVAVVIVVAGAVLFVPGITQPTVVTKTTTLTTTVTAATTTTTSTTTPARQYKMALVIGGDETDAGWNAVGIQAAQLVAAKYSWNTSISRDVAYSDQVRVMTTYAQSGYDVVWAHGGQFIGDTYNIAKQFPKTVFIQSPGPQNMTPPPNMVSLGPSFQVTGYYQAGVLAGKMTKTNAVAVVMGAFYDYIAEEFYAFQAGVQSANPNAKVYARVAGTWADPSLGFQIAQALIQTKHVDIIAQIADATGRGVIAAAQQYNASIIGTVGDQAALAPTITMTSVMMNTTGFIEYVVQNIVRGTFGQIGGKVINMNLGYLAPSHPYGPKIPQEVQAALAQTAQGIKSGSIVVPQKVTQNPPPDPA